MQSYAQRLLFPKEAAVRPPAASMWPRLLLGDDYGAKSLSGERFLMSFETQQRKFVRVSVRVQPEGLRAEFTAAGLLAREEQLVSDT